MSAGGENVTTRWHKATWRGREGRSRCTG